MKATVKLLQYQLLFELINCGVEQTEFTAIIHPPRETEKKTTSNNTVFVSLKQNICSFSNQI